MALDSGCRPWSTETAFIDSPKGMGLPGLEIVIGRLWLLCASLLRTDETMARAGWVSFMLRACKACECAYDAVKVREELLASWEADSNSQGKISKATFYHLMCKFAARYRAAIDVPGFMEFLHKALLSDESILRRLEDIVHLHGVICQKKHNGVDDALARISKLRAAPSAPPVNVAGQTPGIKESKSARPARVPETLPAWPAQVQPALAVSTAWPSLLLEPAVSTGDSLTEPDSPISISKSVDTETIVRPALKPDKPTAVRPGKPGKASAESMLWKNYLGSLATSPQRSPMESLAESPLTRHPEAAPASQARVACKTASSIRAASLRPLLMSRQSLMAERQHQLLSFSKCPRCGRCFRNPANLERHRGADGCLARPALLARPTPGVAGEGGLDNSMDMISLQGKALSLLLSGTWDGEQTVHTYDANWLPWGQTKLRFVATDATGSGGVISGKGVTCEGKGSQRVVYRVSGTFDWLSGKVSLVKTPQSTEPACLARLVPIKYEAAFALDPLRLVGDYSCGAFVLAKIGGGQAPLLPHRTGRYARLVRNKRQQPQPGWHLGKSTVSVPGGVQEMVRLVGPTRKSHVSRRRGPTMALVDSKDVPKAITTRLILEEEDTSSRQASSVRPIHIMPARPRTTKFLR